MKLWKARAAGSLGGVIVGGLMVLAMTACDSGVVGDLAADMRDRTGFEQARKQLQERHAPQSVSLFSGPGRASLEIMHDDANGVTCWSRKGYHETSLTCLPDWMLTRAERLPLTDACLVKDVGVSEACRLLLDPQGVAK